MGINKKIKIILCGGGTGGHIFPMLSIADEIKKQNNKSEILFVGSKDRMEMQIVPKYNYPIKGLWISGIKRSSFLLNVIFIGIPFILKNISLPFKILHSLIKSLFILIQYRPDIVVGFGGYSSGPFLLVASLLGYKTAIQEQNSFPGYTNRILSKKVNVIFVAFENLEKYFKNNQVFNLGNPIRSSIKLNNKSGYNHFGLERNKKTILVVGGSLGAKSINESILTNLSLIRESSFQLIWQTGSNYYNVIQSKKLESTNIKILPFIDRMDLAYSVADVIISRAGAIAISELCVVGKPLILVPSPNVVDDHQTKNAQDVLTKKACLVVNDYKAKDILLTEVINLLNDNNKLMLISSNLKELAKPNASKNIVNELYNLL
ncbi:MAG: undecaprenyldiphospho-muramoylpentapeptide beta-N-acetylglucosaminyltransferase [Bacteroidota bacterium]|nr:undecaprenyldiphospho-muramoylpentapeptide beta-N-acetylglucosaminyltransferase [Bacteroidota bacterium]